MMPQEANTDVYNDIARDVVHEAVEAGVNG